jgi:signal peptidase I
VIYIPGMKYLKGALKILLWVAIVGAIILAIGRFTFWVPGETPDNAMAPNIWRGDKLIILTRGTIERGSMVYCDHPVYTGQVVVGRVVGLPGDTVEIVGGQLKLNDDDIFSDWEPNPITVLDKFSGVNVLSATFKKGSQNVGGHVFDIMVPEKGSPVEMRQFKVKSGYFLMGDNRALSYGASDSREYGEVHPSLCKGRVLMIWKASKGLGDPDLTIRSFKFLL